MICFFAAGVISTSVGFCSPCADRVAEPKQIAKANEMIILIFFIAKKSWLENEKKLMTRGTDNEVVLCVFDMNEPNPRSLWEIELEVFVVSVH